MKTIIFPITAIILFLGLSACGTEYTIPATDRQAVTFSYCDPDAEAVFLAGEMNGWNPKTIPMESADGSNWIKTLYLNDGIWQYKFVVDGVWQKDQKNPKMIDDGYGGNNSLLVIGSKFDGFLYVSGIPHGTVTNVTMKSEILGTKTSFNIYLPPDYSLDKTYPVLYLLHGLGQNENQWTTQGYIQNYMDYLIHEGTVKPFIVVMPSAGKSFYTNKMEKFVAGELADYIDAKFKTKAGKANTAITGMSMGGFGAFYLAQRNPGKYGLSIPLSGYFDDVHYLQTIKDKPLPVDFQLEIYCGSEDRVCFDSNEALKAILNKNNIKFGYYISKGGHDWFYWRGLMKEVLMKISGFFYPEAG